VARLILLNGPPGIGKSTIAARYVTQHPGVLNCDIDVLRTLVGGWQDDFIGAGGRIRSAALALMTAYLRGGDDVVLPQLVARVAEVERFERAALEADATFVEVMLTDDVEASVARFHARPASDELQRVTHGVVSADGGDDALRHFHAALLEVADARPGTRLISTTGGDIDGSYAAVMAAVERVSPG
jgi:predicted kinase